MTFAAMSLSIWPFYLGLFALVGIGGQQMSASNEHLIVGDGPQKFAAPAGMVRTASLNGGASAGGCGSSGCGSAGGCGNGGCGASSGKGCTSCGANPSAPRGQQPVPAYPVQAYYQLPNGARAVQGGYQQPPQQMMPQAAQVQRLPNGAMVNARPPTGVPNAPNMTPLQAARILPQKYHPVMAGPTPVAGNPVSDAVVPPQPVVAPQTAPAPPVPAPLKAAVAAPAEAKPQPTPDAGKRLQP
jgi:hypothetical protein